MPGIGVRTAARILLEVGDASTSPAPDNLAAYVGIAPVTRSSGTSIKGEHPARTGYWKLKRAFFLAAFAALHDPFSWAYHDRKRAEGRKHNAALICLPAAAATSSKRCFAKAPTTDAPIWLPPPLRLDNHIVTHPMASQRVIA